MNEVHNLVIPMDYATGGGMAGSDKYRKLSVEDGVTRMVMGAVACKPHLRLGPPRWMWNMSSLFDELVATLSYYGYQGLGDGFCNLYENPLKFCAFLCEKILVWAGQKCIRGRFGKTTYKANGARGLAAWNHSAEELIALHHNWRRVEKRTTKNIRVLDRIIMRWFTEKQITRVTTKTFFKATRSIQYAVLISLKLDYEPKHIVEEILGNKYYQN